MAGSSGGAVPPDGPARMRRRTAPDTVSISDRRHDHDDERHPGEAVLPELEAVVEHLPDAADAEHAEHRRHPDVDLEAVEHERGDLRHRLGHHGPTHPLQLRRPDGVGRLDRPVVDPLDDLRAQLAERADRADGDRHDPRRLGQPEHRDQGEHEDQLGHGRSTLNS